MHWVKLFAPNKVCLISPGTDLPGEWALLALGSFPGLLRQTLYDWILEEWEVWGLSHPWNSYSCS